jgi:hypothetical protein
MHCNSRRTCMNVSPSREVELCHKHSLSIVDATRSNSTTGVRGVMPAFRPVRNAECRVASVISWLNSRPRLISRRRLIAAHRAVLWVRLDEPASRC